MRPTPPHRIRGLPPLDDIQARLGHLHTRGGQAAGRQLRALALDHIRGERWADLKDLCAWAAHQPAFGPLGPLRRSLGQWEEALLGGLPLPEAARWLANTVAAEAPWEYLAARAPWEVLRPLLPEHPSTWWVAEARALRGDVLESQRAPSGMPLQRFAWEPHLADDASTARLTLAVPGTGPLQATVLGPAGCPLPVEPAWTEQLSPFEAWETAHVVKVRGTALTALATLQTGNASAAEKGSESGGLPRLSATEAGPLSGSLCFATASSEASAAEKGSESGGLPRLSATEAGPLSGSLRFATASSDAIVNTAPTTLQGALAQLMTVYGGLTPFGRFRGMTEARRVAWRLLAALADLPWPCDGAVLGAAFDDWSWLRFDDSDAAPEWCRLRHGRSPPRRGLGGGGLDDGLRPRAGHWRADPKKDSRPREGFGQPLAYPGQALMPTQKGEACAAWAGDEVTRTVEE